jgi:hypothetical protein
MPAYDQSRFDPPAPVALVSLRNPESHETVIDVPMLIDSAADLTLLPTAFVRRLGPSVTTERDYELEAFDGSKTVARSVKLELKFLKHKFTGRFVLLDSPCGILGRNVLNHFALVLDGPNLTWTESITR